MPPIPCAQAEAPKAGVPVPAPPQRRVAEVGAGVQVGAPAGGVEAEALAEDDGAQGEVLAGVPCDRAGAHDAAAAAPLNGHRASCPRVLMLAIAWATGETTGRGVVSGRAVAMEMSSLIARAAMGVSACGTAAANAPSVSRISTASDNATDARAWRGAARGA